MNVERSQRKIPTSIQADQKHGSFGDLIFANHRLRALAVVIRHSHSHPPVPRRTRELQDFRRLIPPLKTIRPIPRLPFRPKKIRSERTIGRRCRAPRELREPQGEPWPCLADTHPGLWRPPVKDQECALRQTDPIGNAQQRRMSRLHICYPDNRAQRQREVRRRHRIHVVDFAIGAAAIVIRRTIPTRHAGLFKNRPGVRRNLNIVRGFGGRLPEVAFRRMEQASARRAQAAEALPPAFFCGHNPPSIARSVEERAAAAAEGWT